MKRQICRGSTRAFACMVAGLFGTGVCLAAGDSRTSAGTIACAADEMPIPDERSEDAQICLKKSEWEKAKEICQSNATQGESADPLQCLCQDADTVGACGN